LPVEVNLDVFVEIPVEAQVERRHAVGPKNWIGETFIENFPADLKAVNA